MTWEDLLRFLARPLAEAGPGWAPVAFLDDRRRLENVQEAHAFVGDLDDGAIRLETIREALAPYRCVVHSTRRHTPSAPRWRFVVATSRPVTPDEYKKIWEHFATKLPLDRRARDASRFWFVPSLPAEGPYEFHPFDGDELDPVALTRPSGIRPAKGGAAMRRARAYVEKAEPSISGQGGHDNAMRVATAVVRGFSLSEADAFDVLQSWNASCQPPWSDRELRHKIAEAAARGDMAWGAKLDEPPPESTRPIVRVGAEVHETVNAAIEAIGSNAAIFARGGQLVRVVHTERSPVIRPTSAATLLEVLTAVAIWERYDGRQKDDPWVRSKPPADVVAAVLDRGQWSGVRTLTGVVEAPSLRPDGTVLQGGAGYDAATGYLYLPNATFPPVPSAPTQNDAVVAAAHLLEVVQDFPFASPAHRSAWLAFLLTLFARAAIQGCVPLMALDATTRGTGKTKLADVTSLIATGREVPKHPCPEKDEEIRKVLTTLLAEGERFVLFDNLAATLNYPSLDAALTSTVWKDRILGRSQSIEVPNETVFGITGNNLHFEGDTARRTLHIRLESPLENPEDRDDFRHDDLLEHVRKHRPSLVRDALTILRAYYAAGAPPQGCKPWGSFESWTRVVANCLVWLGLPDPQATRAALADADVGKTMLASLLAGWERFAPEGATVKTALSALYPMQRATPPDGFDDLREAIEHFAPSIGGKPPNPRRLGDALRTAKRRVVNGRWLESGSANGGSIRWFVCSSGGSRGSRGSVTIASSETMGSLF